MTAVDTGGGCYNYSERGLLPHILAFLANG
ncbi:hypothetical protein PL11201_370031 [Planktothrix sp. PCC 11201]|nr:hypothetical protein PL11201_370031 [Planktothrix sp. PCC 11201]